MIEINGLTPEQVEMLDFMWNDLETEQDFEQWYDSLDERQQQMAEILMRMVLIESREEDEDLGDMTEAKTILQKFTK
jgi:hypothetical protein